MKILLIYPYCLEDRLQDYDVRVVPIGAYYIGAVLKANHHDVEILNWHNINKTPGRIKEILKEKRPDIIGFSILHANRWGGIEVAQIAKQLNPTVKIVFGGVGATFLWKHFLSHFKEIDFIVMREGEYTFSNLIKCIEKADYEHVEDIKGICFRKEDKILKTEDAPFIQNIDELPNPAKYFKYQHVISSRGCPWNCTFCGSPRFWKRKVRFHSPEYFVEQLELLYKKGINFFYFSDDTFTLKGDRVIEICKKILERNLDITWFAISRVNCVSEETLYWMRKAGCIQISYGVESGSEKIRNCLNKNIKIHDIKKAFDLTTKYGILARAYFIYGSPGESRTTIQKTIDLMHVIKPMSTIFYILDLFPGTALYSDFKKKFKISDKIWLQQIEDIMYFDTDPRLSKDTILAFGEKLRSEYYANLHRYVDSIELIDKKDLYKLHSDFCSRLGMTFSHGDYAKIDAIREKDKTAEKLFKRALGYYPDHRAYLGLGIIKQKNKAFDESVIILSEGIKCFPGSEPLNTCLGISYMNLGQYSKALSCLLKFPDSRKTVPYIASCYKALGDSEKESAFLEKLRNIELL
ncbi:MAG: radical SAM protein [Deltaproteobacteria bacterium]|nr:radical SAM protein [Deltaproteobacteria bacterium]MBW1964553.1 radical SAM protein [Deltaproteobacteria bacterium]